MYCEYLLLWAQLAAAELPADPVAPIEEPRAAWASRWLYRLGGVR